MDKFQVNLIANHSVNSLFTYFRVVSADSNNPHNNSAGSEIDCQVSLFLFFIGADPRTFHSSEDLCVASFSLPCEINASDSSEMTNC